MRKGHIKKIVLHTKIIPSFSNHNSCRTFKMSTNIPDCPQFNILNIFLIFNLNWQVIGSTNMDDEIYIALLFSKITNINRAFPFLKCVKNKVFSIKTEYLHILQ